MVYFVLYGIGTIVSHRLDNWYHEKLIRNVVKNEMNGNSLTWVLRTSLMFIEQKYKE